LEGDAVFDYVHEHHAPAVKGPQCLIEKAGMADPQDWEASHTAFFHQRTWTAFPALIRSTATFAARRQAEGKRWMFVDVIEDGVAFQAGNPPRRISSFHRFPIRLFPPKISKFPYWRQNHPRPRLAGLTAVSANSPLASQTETAKRSPANDRAAAAFHIAS